MEQSTAIWVIIGLSLLTANMPFVVERPLLALPWVMRGAPVRAFWVRWLEALVFFGLLAGVAWVGYGLIATALVSYGDTLSILGFYGRIVTYVGVLAVLMAWPGRRVRGHEVEKSVWVRLLEMFVLYLLVGVLAFALEQNLGNRFPQTWEFYAITGSLYVVLGFPAFVYRYLMRRPKKRPASRQPVTAQRPATQS